MLWGSENRDPAGHTGGPVLMEVGGVACAAVLTARNLVVTRLDREGAGKTVATYPWTTDFINNIACPVAVGASVLITSRYNIGKMAKLDISLAGGARLAWENKVPSGVCTPVVHEGRIYFANKGFHCVDLADGKELWEGGRYGDPGSVILTADGRLVAWANDGDLTLVETAARSPRRYTELATKRRVLRDMAWPHLALAGGRLYCKDRGGRIRCLGLDPTERAAPAVVPTPGLAAAPAGFELGEWPGEGAQLVLGWRRGGGKRGLLGAVAKAGRCAWVPRGEAGFGAGGDMALDGGSFGLTGGAGTLLDRLKGSGQFSFELVLRTRDLDQGGPARIVTFSESAYSRNFTIGQERGRLVLRLRTPGSGENGMKPEVVLTDIEAGAWAHLVVCYRPGTLVCFLNGREVSASAELEGGFGNWTAQHFRVGDEHDGGRPWAGELAGLAVFDRAMGADSVARRFAAIAKAGAE